jgi:hypothetical protein
MDKIKRLTVLIGCFFIACVNVMAQDTTNTIGRVSIASPNAASLGKYGDIPVSYHTGLPNIDIPIYTVESGSLKLPISLSYHASGLKVQESASWVGAGWTLNAGGMVTRTVLGAADDKGRNDMGSYVLKAHYTDFGYNGIINSDAQSGIQLQNTDHFFTFGWEDDEPDLYFFNFGGYIGKFYFNDDRIPILVPEQDFKIQTYISTQQGFTGFIITTPDGVRYFFGQIGNNGTTNPVEATITATGSAGSASSAANASWFLNKIMSSDGIDSITFQYTKENYSYYTLAFNKLPYGQYVPTNPTKICIGLIKNCISGVRLTQINFANGSISFTPVPATRSDLSDYNNFGSLYDGADTSAHALGSISIKNTNGFCKKDSFYYSYFTDNTALNSLFFTGYSLDSLHSDKYRLRLDSIQETTCDASIKLPPYKFSYFSELVPRKLSFGIDHWGYYNGADTNKVLVPTYTATYNGSPTTYGGANRDAAWPAMRGGSLQKIIYPTGGSTTLDFEPKNTYTFNSSILENIQLASLVVNEYGQSNITQTVNFTTSGTGSTVITVHNTSTNWSPTLSITNSSGTNVAGTPVQINVNSTYTTTQSLSAGTYTATLYFPTNSQSTLINGADATIGQYQYVTSQTSLLVSGLRIKNITNSDGITPTNIVTSYNYTAGGTTSTGVLYSRPVYVQTIRNSINALVWPYSPFNGCWTAYGTNGYFISPGSLEPMATTQGENLGFDEVDVSQTGNGKSVYRYYGSNYWQSSLNDVCTRSLNQTGSCDYNIPDYPAVPLPFEFMRGELKYEGHYNNSGAILNEKYYYPVYTNDSIKTPGHIVGTIPTPMGTSAVYFTEYYLQSAAKTQNKIVEIDYDPSNFNSLSKTTTVYYQSRFHHQPTRKVTTTSTGDSLITKMQYAMDFRISSCDASIPDSFAYYMNKMHIDSTYMDSAIIYCTPQVNTTDNCRLYVYSNYRDSIAKHRVAFANYRRRSYGADTANILSNCYDSSLATADTLLKPVLRLQNEYYNASIESSEWKDLNLLHVSYTRFDSSVSPLGYVYPGRTQLINLQATSTTFTNAAVSGNTISKDSRYVDESFYTFNNGNPVQVTPHDGIANSYIWDYLNKEPIAKVSNAPISQIAYTSFEADGKGNWTFTGTPATDATSPTGGKCYSLASGSISKSGLTSGTKYILSLWKRTGASVTITGGTNTSVTGKTINNWTYIEYTVTGATSITMSGSGYIDELRLYPSNAQMVTYTYTPLLGMTSTCDVDNKITYYFYDGFGRLKWIKDQDGNIIKTIQYHYQTIPGLQY